MKSAVIIIVLAVLGICSNNAERIYKPPVINPVNFAATVRPGLSYSGAAGGSNVPNNPRPNSFGGSVPPVVPPRSGAIPPLRQPEFLPQNLTFIVSARNLKSKSVDPIIKVSNSSQGSPFEKLGKTEELSNNQNPDFFHVFWVVWKKGTQQKLKLEVRDVDNLRRDDPLGEVTVDLDEYVAKGEKLNVTLKNGTGTVLIQKTTPIKFKLYARTLPSLDTIGKSDPFAEVYWSYGSSGRKIKLGSTSVIDNEENPDWKETFEFANYIKGSDQYLTIKVLDKDPTGADSIGEATIEIDPYIAKRSTKILKIGKTGASTLAITPTY